MNIIALVTHLKLVAQEAKKYAAGLASELSNANAGSNAGNGQGKG